MPTSRYPRKAATALFIAATAIASLAACSNTDETVDTGSRATSSASSTTQTSAAPVAESPPSAPDMTTTTGDETDVSLVDSTTSSVAGPDTPAQSPPERSNDAARSAT
ncbi:MAG: hypothetical protein KAZ88_05830, partial [Acidimicrobiia bacterium]|nr:hypothetical protein [Acidimicrobiia bacterium]